MAYKQFLLDDHTTITIYKRKVSRNLRLSVAANGEVRVSIPTWAPYAMGLKFAATRHGWIAARRGSTRLLQDGQAVGKAHHLHFVASATATRPSTSVRSGQVRVTHPSNVPVRDTAVQRAAESAAIRALRLQAEQLLPGRLANLAAQHGFEYRSVTIKRLKSRWGSCDQDGNIALNLFLMQLPWDGIDYVLLHELMHTRLLRHGPEFWQAMEGILPNVKALRKTLREYQPVLDNPLA